MNAAGTRSVLFLLAAAWTAAVSGQSPGSFASPSLLTDDFGGTRMAAWYTNPSAAQDTLRTANARHPSSHVPAVRGYTPMTSWDNPPTADSTRQQPGTPSSSSDDTWIVDDWGGAACRAPACGPTWYVGANGLIFTRNRPKFSQISFDDTDPVGQVLSTDSGLGRWDAGPEVTIGWMLSPLWALEFTYWGLYGDTAEETVYAANLAGNLNTVFDFGPLNIGFDNVNDLYDAAQAHRIRRDFDVNNFELNVIAGRTPWFDGRSWRVSYLAGVRYLRFTEDFQYATARAEPIFGANLAQEAYYDIDVRNNLWGFQLGGRADWFWTERFSVYTEAKFGIYGNSMRQHSRIYNVNGTAEVGPGNPLAGQLFDISSSKTLTSFLGELDLGLSYQFTTHWTGVIGYRAIAISGIAYATDQIPANMADLPGVADIDSNAHMVLHGGYVGAIYSW